MVYDEFCTRLNRSNATAAAQAQYAAQEQAAWNAYYQQHGTMRPEMNDPDSGVKAHGDVVEMVYDEFKGAWVEPRALPKPA